MSKRSRNKNKRRKQNLSSKNVKRDKKVDWAMTFFIVLLLFGAAFIIVVKNDWFGVRSWWVSGSSSQSIMEGGTGGPALPPEVLPTDTIEDSIKDSPKQEPNEKPEAEDNISDFAVIFDREQFVQLNNELENQIEELGLPEFDIALKFTDDRSDVVIKRWVYPDVPTPQPEQTSSITQAASPTGVSSGDNLATGDELDPGNPAEDVDENLSSAAPEMNPPPKPRKERIEFNHIFEPGSNAKQNGGVNADEEFLIELPINQQHTELVLQLVINQTGTPNIEWPKTMVFYINCEAPTKTGGTRQLKLFAGQEWKFQKTVLTQMKTVTVHTTDGNKDRYVMYQPKDSIKGWRVNSARLELPTKKLVLYLEQDPRIYCSCLFSDRIAPKLVWLPILSNTSVDKGTIFKESDDSIPLSKAFTTLGYLYATKMISAEPRWGIAPDLRDRIMLRSVDSVGSYDPIPDFEERLRYITTEDNIVRGIAIHSEVGQTDYYPLSMDQVHSMHGQRWRHILPA